VASDTERLRYMMEEGPDGFMHVTKDRYEYAAEVADEEGHDEPTPEDELEGFRRMIENETVKEKQSGKRYRATALHDGRRPGRVYARQPKTATNTRRKWQTKKATMNRPRKMNSKGSAA
jgi:hypothetical protein